MARWPLAEPIGCSVSSRLADSVCYSFPPTTDKDSLKGSLPWLFITETMPPQSVIPKARESRTPSSSSKVKYPEEGQFGASGGFENTSRNLSKNNGLNEVKNIYDRP